MINLRHIVPAVFGIALPFACSKRTEPAESPEGSYAPASGTTAPETQTSTDAGSSTMPGNQEGTGGTLPGSGTDTGTGRRPEPGSRTPGSAPGGSTPMQKQGDPSANGRTSGASRRHERRAAA